MISRKEKMFLQECKELNRLQRDTAKAKDKV